MVPNDALINALRSLGYTFKKQTERVHIYKKQGSIDRVTFRRNQLHTPEAVRGVLRNAGMSKEEIERFMAEADR